MASRMARRTCKLLVRAFDWDAPLLRKLRASEADGVGQRNAASLAKGAPHWMDLWQRDAVVYPRQLANERIVHEPLRRRRPEDAGTTKRLFFLFGLPYEYR